MEGTILTILGSFVAGGGGATLATLWANRRKTAAEARKVAAEAQEAEANAQKIKDEIEAALWERAKVALKERDNDVILLKEQVINLIKDNAEKDKEIALLKKQVAELTTDRDRISLERAELQEQLERANGRIQQLEQEVELMRDELARRDQERRRPRGKIT